MMITTRGMVLTRQPYREYDDKILFYTEVLGKVWVYCFGSRSPKSLRGQSLAQSGWMDLILERKRNRLLLKELSHHGQAYLSKDYFLGWSHFLKDLTEKIPYAVPTPKIFSLLRFLSEPEFSQGFQDLLEFREFTWYFSTLVELGILPDFSHCQQCQEYCSDWYFFSLPGEVVGNSCTVKLENIRGNHWFPEQLAIEDVYFLNYSQKKYVRNPKFFERIFTLSKRLSSQETESKLMGEFIERHRNSERKLSIEWERILPVLRVILKH